VIFSSTGAAECRSEFIVASKRFNDLRIVCQNSRYGTTRDDAVTKVELSYARLLFPGRRNGGFPQAAQAAGRAEPARTRPARPRRRSMTLLLRAANDLFSKAR